MVSAGTQATTRPLRMERMAIKVRRGSGNVCNDLGFADQEATNLHLRSDLMIQLRKRLSAEGATQAQAAKLLGVSQPRVSDLLRGGRPG